LLMILSAIMLLAELPVQTNKIFFIRKQSYKFQLQTMVFVIQSWLK
jgi:hypothetical protein